MTLLDELQLTSGSIKIGGNMAYASQQPWVFSASVRQNILFGQKFDMKKYQKVIKAAALTKVNFEVVEWKKLCENHLNTMR